MKIKVKPLHKRKDFWKATYELESPFFLGYTYYEPEGTVHQLIKSSGGYFSNVAAREIETFEQAEVLIYQLYLEDLKGRLKQIIEQDFELECALPETSGTGQSNQ